MKFWTKLRAYWWLLTIFWLFAVYSTSIWKSFDQRLTVSVMQNIETVKSFNTFLDDTIISTTQAVLDNIQKTVVLTTEELWTGGFWWVDSQESWVITGAWESGAVVPNLETLKKSDTDQVKLVDQGTKKVQLRNNYVLFRSQMRNLIVALIAMFFVYFLPLWWLKEKKFIWFVFIATFIFQLLVFSPLAATNWEARWWVDLWVLPNMQPSEFFKVWYVLFMAYWLNRRKDDINGKGFVNKFFVQFTIINFIVLCVILCIPDMWTLFILALTWTIMAWYMGFSLKKILVLWGWAILIASVWVLWLSVVNPDNYAYQRIKTFFTTDEQEKKDIELKEWWQIQQWLIAIWAWGFFWQWYGKWLQKMWQLPEAYSDMIFAAFSEEIGFVWNMILFLLYIWLFIVVLKRIPYLKDPQMKVLCVWIISLITIQVFVHVGVNVEVLPNTWLTLPFISHGGTALLINLVELMILYKILNSVKERSEREIRIDNE